MIGAYSHVLKRMKRALVSMIFILAVIGFCFMPASGDQIRLVCSWNRVFFALCCFGVVSSVYILNPIFKPFFSTIFRFFGESCYSIYLLHPLVAIPIVFVASKIGVNKPFAYVTSFFSTLLVSWVSYRFLEKPMMLLGRQVADKINLNKPMHDDTHSVTG